MRAKQQQHGFAGLSPGLWISAGSHGHVFDHHRIDVLRVLFEHHHQPHGLEVLWVHQPRLIRRSVIELRLGDGIFSDLHSGIVVSRCESINRYTAVLRQLLHVEFIRRD